MNSALLPRDQHLLRLSLAAVWLTTAVVNVFEWQGQSLALLRQAGLQDLTLMHTLIAAGSATDLALGLLLWLHPRRAVYAAALLMMLVMTVVATALLPTLWLHPLGPLLKNLPIAAALWLLWKAAP